MNKERDTQRLTVAQATLKFLAAQYSERDGQRQRLIPGVWGIFGHGNVAGLGQALEEYGDELGLPTYRPQNEQGMVHVAAAYARHRNRLATFACTASVGPGSTNMITGAALATVNRLPVLLLPSDIFANRIPDPVLQQVEHSIEHDLSANDCFRPVSRFYTRISRPEQLLSALPEAMRVLTDPAETGAVVVSLPEDVQAEAYDWPASFFDKRVWHVRRPPPEQVLIEQAAELIRRAERPLIVCGGGVIYSGAEEALSRLADELNLPVCESQAGKGALPWNHPLNVGPIGSIGGLAANRLAREADLVIAVGTRLGDFVTASKTAFQQPDVQVIGINVVPMDAAKLGALSVVADAREALRALHGALRGWRAPQAYRDEVSELKTEWNAAVDAARADTGSTPPAQGAVIGAVNDVLGGHATVVCAAGSMPGDLVRLWRAEDPGAYHVEYGFSCMGYEIPAGLGIQLAEPGRRVVVMIGDGSYLMMNSELVTAVAENVNLTVVLVDNRAFMSIRGLQMECGSPSFNNELRHRNPATGRTDGPVVQLDFVKHAQGLGASAMRAETLDELRAALNDAGAQGGVHVIVVPVNLRERVPGFESWWDVPIAEVSGQAGVRQTREHYEEKVADQVRYFAPTTVKENV
ncbi:3D-(3,5/4)-trihydroxycyclohexane-1,2-dione acylhydrolase (decyclizing) (plasmid) [Deinococcus metallilatus]|uniref:3D-(3,5/4)-trihydroxycyclohexane-1,2-dione acylhydrolase (Decyclizing) n=1 Tax=Deinococcus metallilatus TaxID=1211322 RepID=A0AAJ5FAD5_9DEIO|nr:3D-(3,5/4)-trihydroxycyclohexane-1,2-dione acylhydrolase (decyclizing) [Deinococcus metallilatus]MBB5295626.1 3D-(3,5/4)-trihydroxycyclohexane-1,2-dione acylhydrolase (decyclizing) [Deinococcus metallilatus]QBY06912.1 3D-(3,5/4)-trihydroxycyclohexane-1,2-dione acylhydrolase (decyclizing) [Deinococcus metallilatus]TLK32302.1 3D-(3,5/4)-trihydroxycyclohexane-1,2-dione acylhydrolase (decyclizing) [Deinococcus metallilatus]GMA14155.1 3D-(3,5/4)-trihydroxycyclohexane-1,2-dione acylhydrolase (decy